ncbi:unnamed protein product [Echinostoma caproni]|uniref:Uncharacterized protein n=1 Tax=Echinostoma caproni TaxID=27848 RepID=A0A3P8IEP8_9TREM|nr:unnamed protein product [Echinostoma caproni]
MVYDDRMLQHRHEWSCSEQESPARLQRAYERCHEEGLISRCMLVPVRCFSSRFSFLSSLCAKIVFFLSLSLSPHPTLVRDFQCVTFHSKPSSSSNG